MQQALHRSSLVPSGFVVESAYYYVLHVALGVETRALLQAQIHEGKVYHDCPNLRQRPFYSFESGHRAIQCPTCVS
jgi:hypothetical protein